MAVVRCVVLRCCSYLRDVWCNDVCCLTRKFNWFLCYVTRTVCIRAAKLGKFEGEEESESEAMKREEVKAIYSSLGVLRTWTHDRWNANVMCMCVGWVGSKQMCGIFELSRWHPCRPGFAHQRQLFDSLCVLRSLQIVRSQRLAVRRKRKRFPKFPNIHSFAFASPAIHGQFV